MKSSAATWLWIIGGLMIGIAVIGFAVSIFGGMMRSYQENDVIEQVYQLGNRAESVCQGGFGNLDFMKIELPDFVRAVYPARSGHQKPPDRVAQFITDKEAGSGKYICLSFFGKPEPRCREISCSINMSYIGSPSLKDDLFSVLSKISGDYPTYKFSLSIEKGMDVVYILRERRVEVKECDLEGIPEVEVWGTCAPAEHPVLFIFNQNVTIFGDIHPWVEGPKGFAQTLSKVAEHFGNGKTLVITEGKGVSFVNLSLDVKDVLASVDADEMNHSKTLTATDLEGFEQLWLVRPGWCDTCQRRGKIDASCDGTEKWTEQEAEVIDEFVRNDGKLLIITDSSEILTSVPDECKGQTLETMPREAINKILAELGASFEQVRQTADICTNTNFRPTGLGDIENFKIKYSAKFCPN